MWEPDYPSQWDGDDTEHLITGDYLRVVRQLPPGSVVGRRTFLYPMVEVETTDGARLVVARAYVRPR